MNDYNHFSFIGRLTKNAELRYTASGTGVVEFSVACNEKFKDKEHVSYFSVILWGQLGIALEKYLLKGQQVLVAGRIRQDRWEKDGKTYNAIKFIASDVQLVGSSKNNVAGGDVNNDPYQSNNSYYNGDIPF